MKTHTKTPLSTTAEVHRRGGVNMAGKEAQRIRGGASEVTLEAKQGGRPRRWGISRERIRLGSARKRPPAAVCVSGAVTPGRCAAESA